MRWLKLVLCVCIVTTVTGLVSEVVADSGRDGCEAADGVVIAIIEDPDPFGD